MKRNSYFQTAKEKFVYILKILVNALKACVITYTSSFISDIFLAEALMFIPLIFFPYAFTLFSCLKYLFIILILAATFKDIQKKERDKSIFFDIFDSFFVGVLFVINLLKYAEIFSFIKEKLSNPQKWKILKNAHKIYNITIDLIGGYIYAEYNTSKQINKLKTITINEFNRYMFYVIKNIFSPDVLNKIADHIITLATVVKLLYTLPYISGLMMMPIVYIPVISIIVIVLLINKAPPAEKEVLEQDNIFIKILSFMVTLSVSIAFAHLTALTIFSIPPVACLIALINYRNAYVYLFAFTKMVFTITFTAQMQPQVYQGLAGGAKQVNNFVNDTLYSEGENKYFNYLTGR